MEVIVFIILFGRENAHVHIREWMKFMICFLLTCIAKFQYPQNGNLARMAIGIEHKAIEDHNTQTFKLNKY